MYLARSIQWKGQRAEMVGSIAGDISMHAKPVGRGYVILTPGANHPWQSGHADEPQPVHAHEFHYSSLDGLPADTIYAYSMQRGHGIDGQHDGIVQGNLLASYTHLRTSAGCNWPARFVAQVRRCIQQKTENQTTPEEPNPCSR
jgi:cobyrinic acid a,c-diamide synthase